MTMTQSNDLADFSSILQRSFISRMLPVWGVVALGAVVFWALTILLAPLIASPNVLLFVATYCSVALTVVGLVMRERQKGNVMATDSNNSTERTVSSESAARTRLAFTIIGLSIAGMFILALISIIAAQDRVQAIERVMSSFLPLLGTWVGTVLAFYFSKENFDAAQRSVDRLVDKIGSTEEKLRATLAKDQMIPYGQIFAVHDEKTKLKDVKDELDLKDYNRVPVFDRNEYPCYVVHKSIITEFLAGKALDKTNTKSLEDFTFEDLYNDPKYTDVLKNSFFTIREDATLAIAKDLMSTRKFCQDVFVTADGTNQSRVLGWVTNVIITVASVV